MADTPSNLMNQDLERVRKLVSEEFTLSLCPWPCFQRFWLLPLASLLLPPSLQQLSPSLLPPLLFLVQLSCWLPYFRPQPWRPLLSLSCEPPLLLLRYFQHSSSAL